ncbi:DUF6331 family protein [Larkinella sp. VNQ87]|uniref:DUF6331 family protein n=1 Tax=Larkinella sp. VNQ87 TaxID=3400921 RepID=UPI003C01F19D
MAQTISIGPDQEIKLIEFDYDPDSVLEVDELLGYSSDAIAKYHNAKDPLGQFWNYLETECLAGCCGIDAFGLWPEDIAKAVKKLDKKGLLEQLEQLRARVVNSREQIVGYHRLNYNFARLSFLELLDYLITEVKK